MTQNNAAQWDEFIGRLSSDFDWDRPDAPMMKRLEALLKGLTDPQAMVANELSRIIGDPARLATYLPHIEYPRPGWDKFILWMDPSDRFRVRLHRFKPSAQVEEGDNTIHDHRWPFCSLILKGSYRETTYKIVRIDEARRTAVIEPATEKEVPAGSVNWSLPGVPHLTANENECFSLFVRGRSLIKFSRVFDIEAQTFRPEFGLTDEICQVMNGMAARIVETESDGVGVRR